jgi:hypothetical protein
MGLCTSFLEPSNPLLPFINTGEYIMTNTEIETNNEPMVQFLAEPFEIGQEISVTGKWVPKTPGGLFRKSTDSKEMLKEWEDIHSSAKADSGILSTEINHAVGADAVLVHHVFRDPDALVHYFETTASKHMQALMHVAKPEQHLFRGKEIPTKVREAIGGKVAQADFGEFLFGFVKNEYRAPDAKNAIQVTAKWTAKSE